MAEASDRISSGAVNTVGPGGDWQMLHAEDERVVGAPCAKRFVQAGITE
jgi:hypothetical protein